MFIDCITYSFAFMYFFYFKLWRFVIFGPAIPHNEPKSKVNLPYGNATTVDLTLFFLALDVFIIHLIKYGFKYLDLVTILAFELNN